MTPETKARIVRFLNDEQTSSTIRAVLEESFLKPRGHDVHILAASKLAIDYLREGWKEMDKSRVTDEETIDKKQNAL